MDHEKKFYKTPKQIEIETGRKFLDICKEMLESGYAPIEIAEKLKLKNSRYISQVIFLDEVKRNNPPNPIFKDAKDITDFERICKEKLNISFEQFLRKKFFEEKLSAYEIAGILNTSNSSAHRYLLKYNLKKSTQQAKKDAIYKGVLNYKDINRKARRTKRKRNNNSTSQEFTRDLLKTYFEKYLIEKNIDQYEVVIGYNEYGILQDNEVDIPIIIINVNTNKYHKISIEYNGVIFHKDIEKDRNKKNRLLESDWEYYVIIDDGDFYKLENNVESIVISIVNALDNI